MKPLSPNSHFVRPFKAFKGFSYNYTFLGTSNSPLLTVDEARIPTGSWVWPDINEPVNADTGRSMRVVYASLESMFYSDTLTTGSNVRLPEFDKGGWSPSILGDVYVVSLSQQTYGEQIRPGSFRITSGSITFSDDGYGKLYNSAVSGTIVGSIFYPLGIAAINKTGSAEGIYLNTGSVITVNYESQLTIYENTIICTLERDEFNYSSNPSLSLFSTSSVSGSVKMLDAFGSGSLNPYITTIGLYNNMNELIVIAKVPRAIRRTPEMDQTFIIRFDA
jgi:hypothetical protein